MKAQQQSHGDQFVDDEASLLARALARDERAWRELVKRLQPALRTLVREAHGFADDAIDDVLGDFWLRLVEKDYRRLRAFDPARGAPLLSWLGFQLSQVAHEHAQRQAHEPETIPLDEAPPIADTRRVDSPAPRMMRVEEVAARWDLNVKTVYAMIARGELAARRCGRVVRISRGVVESFESQGRDGAGRK